MSKLRTMQLDKKLYEEINAYCKLNSLKTRDFIHKILKDAFLKEKYGDSPFAFNKKTESITAEQVIEDKPTGSNDNIEEMITTVVEISEKVHQTGITPLLPTQTLGSDGIQVLQEPKVIFENDEKIKPKRKRTLK